MKLLVLHNFYSSTTGEDLIVNLVSESLKKSDLFEVETHYCYSKKFYSLSPWKKLGMLLSATVPFRISSNLSETLTAFKPDIVLIHNLIPLINPWILKTLNRLRIPIIASIYNYRYFCPAGTCTRDMHFCCDCFPGLPFTAIRNNCLDNIFYSILYAWRNLIQRSFLKYINVFVTSTFYRKGFYEKLLPSKEIKFLAPFLNIPIDLINDTPPKSDYVLFASRLVKEKGVEHILMCARQLPHIKFRICGEGPLRSYCEQFIRSNNLKNITLEGWVEREELLPIIKQAQLLIFPSHCYEFGLVKCEAMLLRTPVLAVDNEANRVIISHNDNGFLYNPIELEALPRLIEELTNDKPLLEKTAQNAFDRVRDYNDEQRFTKGFYDICLCQTERRDS